VIYNNLKGEYSYRYVFSYGELHGEDGVFHKYFEKQYSMQTALLEQYVEQTSKEAPNRHFLRKLNTLINNFLFDVVQQYKEEKPESENEFCSLIPVFTNLKSINSGDCDVGSCCYMKYRKYFNYGFLALPLPVSKDVKKYIPQIIHEIFHYTPIHEEVERNELFLELVSAALLARWHHILTVKADNGEIEKEDFESTYKVTLRWLKDQIRGWINYSVYRKYGEVHDVTVNPMFLDILSATGFEKGNYSDSKPFISPDKIFEAFKICSEKEEKIIRTSWEVMGDSFCWNINHFLSDIYSDIYMTVLCDISAKEYVKIMANSPFFAKWPVCIGNEFNILRFGFMCQLLFNSADWKEQLFDVLQELDSEGYDKERLKNIQDYMNKYDYIVGSGTHFNDIMSGLVKKWVKNAKEIKEKCGTTLEQLKNFEDAEYNTSVLETLSNTLQISKPNMYDIRDVRAREQELYPIHSYNPHAYHIKGFGNDQIDPFMNMFSGLIMLGYRNLEFNFTGHDYDFDLHW